MSRTSPTRPTTSPPTGTCSSARRSLRLARWRCVSDVRRSAECEVRSAACGVRSFRDPITPPISQAFHDSHLAPRTSHLALRTSHFARERSEPSKPESTTTRNPAMPTSLPRLLASIVLAWMLVLAPLPAHDAWASRVILIQFGEPGGDSLDDYKPEQIHDLAAIDAAGAALAVKAMPLG